MPRNGHETNVCKPQNQQFQLVAEYARQITHDFSSSPFAALEIKLIISKDERKNLISSSTASKKLKLCLRGAEKGVKWTGITGEIMMLQSNCLVIIGFEGDLLVVF